MNVKKIDGLQNITYWERLKSLGISSVGRRYQRYKCIYVWKIINGHTLNCGLNWTWDEKHGTLCKTKKIGTYYQTQRSNSFQWIAPRLFNALPRSIRDSKDSPDEFKKKINDFLTNIPDCPLTRDQIPVPMDPFDCTPSNSLIHWIQYLKLGDRR